MRTPTMKSPLAKSGIAAGTAMLAGLGLVAPAVAQTQPGRPPAGSSATAYSATAAGVPGTGRTPLANLAQSSVQTVQVANLPANVGLYALHCAMPSDPRQAPTQCDETPASLVYVPATGEARASIPVPVKVNAEFFGINPNPQAGQTAGGPVDCRAVSCALYVLGAGRDSANPAYVRVWPTAFSPLPRERKDDAVTLTVGRTTVIPAASRKAPRIAAKPARISVRTASGLVPTVTSTGCSIRDGVLTPLPGSATCSLRITTTGGTVFAPLTVTQSLRVA